MRSERLYLEDMCAAIEAIESYTQHLNFEDFINDPMVQSAVERQISIIGEAAARLPQAIRLRSPSTPWRDIIGMRNTLVHAYFGTDMALIWRTIEIEIPKLKAEVEGLIASFR